MKLYLHNTLDKEKQEFKPLKKDFLWMKPTVQMYSCGPTVYNYAHIGNLRAYVFADILKRVLMYNNFKVKHVVNVTDIGHLTSDADDGEDKMVKALKREGKAMTLENMRAVADFYFDQYKKDVSELNIIPADLYPFASDHIKEDITMIQKLQTKNIAYTTTDGIYFDTSKVDYGKLFKVTEDNSHARIDTNTEKRNYKDFALWKFGDKTGVGFEAPWGKGFPGWHIECSAMSERYLGVPFDIHTGGIDHIPVHHNNEIAQTEGAEGKLLAHYWLHNAHITIGDDKMAKSGDNFLSLAYLKENGVSPLAYRYWLLTARYSTRLDFSLLSIKQAETALKNLKHTLSSYPDSGTVSVEAQTKFQTLINDDLDTPKALALVWEILKDNAISPAIKKATILDFDRVLGLELNRKEEIEIPAHIETLLKQRDEARKAKNWSLSDSLREEIKQQGFEVKDTEQGQTLTKIW